MKILVPIKRVVDYNVKVRVKPDGTGVDTNVKMGMNPFDEIALEAAVRFKEAGQASEIIAVSIGDETAQETLRTALAFGADRAYLLKTATPLQPLAIAKLLCEFAKSQDIGLALLGKQAIDDDCNQTGQMLAGLLGWPQATFASHIQLTATHATVTREVDGGLETLKVTLPAVITTDLRLNQPRYIALPNIMKARQKPLEILAAESFAIDLQSKLKVLKVSAPAMRTAGRKVSSVDELIQQLKDSQVLP
ncbi:MAG: electron transfer flavoprotein subunit beta/FixA family protein [Gammaproteobacteria bacterium]